MLDNSAGRWAKRRIPMFHTNVLRIQRNFPTRVPRFDGESTLTFNVLFVHIPKTAGISTLSWLRDRAHVDFILSAKDLASRIHTGLPGDVLCLGHIDIDSLIRLRYLDSEAVNAARSFCVVRHPTDRATSLYSFLRANGRIPLRWSFLRFLEEIRNHPPTPGPFNARGLSACAPQVLWVKQSAWRGPRHILRFESLDSDLESFELGWRGYAAGLPVEQKNSSATRTRAGGRATAIIEDIYREDFQQLGYS